MTPDTTTPNMLRLLPHLVAAGPEQMALDEALLEAATQPTLRLYGWNPPTLSLGYFQDYADIVGRLPAPMPIVRRITGGGAIWHEHEVTYSLVGWLGHHGMPTRMRECYPLLHGAILAALSARGAQLGRQPLSAGDRRYRTEPRCFASPAVDDLVHASGGKALGSAGRDRGGKVLIHGSLKLDTNPWDGIAVHGCGLDYTNATEALQEGIRSALGLTTMEDELTREEKLAKERIGDARYKSLAWVQQRQGPRP